MRILIDICVLGSGSSGNCTIVSDEETTVLIDSGFSIKKISGKLDIPVSKLNGILITHGHSDHMKIVALKNILNYNIPIYLHTDTFDKFKEVLRKYRYNKIGFGSQFRIGTFNIDTFELFHNVSCVGYILTSGNTSYAHITDTGSVTDDTVERLKECDIVSIEANYDKTMLLASGRPWDLKIRVMSETRGHLSNRKCMNLLNRFVNDRTKKVILIHRSGECNSAESIMSAIDEHFEHDVPDGFFVFSEQYDSTPHVKIGGEGRKKVAYDKDVKIVGSKKRPSLFAFSGDNEKYIERYLGSIPREFLKDGFEDSNTRNL